VYDMSASSIIAHALAGVFALIGAVQLVGPSFVRDAYDRWDYSQRVRLMTGLLDVLAALFLATDALRGWGIALAAVLTFGSVVIFLQHREYRCAFPAAALMAALIPATLAVPRTGDVQFIVHRPTAPTGSTLITADDPASSRAALAGASEVN
jgi:hypothetical protein